MINQQKHPIFSRNTPKENDARFLTELFFETVIKFDLPVEAEGDIVDNHLEDSSDLAHEAALIREFIANGAEPEVVLSRLAVRKSEAAHLIANMIRRHAGLATKSLRDLVLSSLNHRMLSPALSRSETVYLKRSALLDEKRGGLSERGRYMYSDDEIVMAADEGHRNFKRPNCQKVIRNAWMKLCPI